MRPLGVAGARVGAPQLRLTLRRGRFVGPRTSEGRARLSVVRAGVGERTAKSEPAQSCDAVGDRLLGDGVMLAELPGALSFGCCTGRYAPRVYRALVRRRVVSNFQSLSAGDYGTVVAQMADDVHHIFAGDHPLGGQRHSRDAFERWFERLYLLFPQLRFEVARVVSSGPLWDIWVAVEWVGHVTPAAGDPYVNEGTHVIRIRRGRVAYVHAYEDSQKVAAACRAMAEAGIEEAAAAPIDD